MQSGRLAAMLADMHCHYPMHVIARAPKWPLRGSPHLTVEAMAEVARRPGWLEELRADVLTFVAEQINHDDEWRVSLDELVEGDVRAVFSVLYEPFAEFDVDQLPGTGPEPGYFDDLVAQIERVEADLEEVDGEHALHEIVTSAEALDRVTGNAMRVARRSLAAR